MAGNFGDRDVGSNGAWVWKSMSERGKCGNPDGDVLEISKRWPLDLTVEVTMKFRFC